MQRPVRGKYHYMFGDHLLVAPIYMDDLNNKVHLPKGKWRYWFDDQEIVEGPVTFEQEFPLEQYPVYIREGAIIPMHIERSYTGIGDKGFEGYLTLRIYPEKQSSYTLYHPGSREKTSIFVEELDTSVKITLEGLKKPHILHLHLLSDPKKVELDHEELSSPEDYYFDNTRHKLIIRTDAYANGAYIVHK